MKLFVLGAGKPAHGDKPSALKLVSNKTTVLDWKIEAFSSILKPKDIHFLGGYNFADVLKNYPDIGFSYVYGWEDKTPLHTLLNAPFEEKDLFVSYSDTIFRKETIKNLDFKNYDVLFCVDSHWKERYSKRSAKDIKKAETIIIDGKEVEFTGLIYFSKKVVKVLEKLDISQVGKNLVDLINYLQKTNFSIESCDLKGDWAEFNSANDVANFILGTKAETLGRLKPLVKKSFIASQVTFTCNEWYIDSTKVLNTIKNSLKGKNLVVRSSSKGEDNWKSSNAGGYESILNVNINSDEAIRDAIERVILSYGDKPNIEDQVLVQPFLENVKLSGVIFTCGLESGSPYYRINFDDITKSTESVTSGTQGDLRTIIVSKLNKDYIKKVEPSLSNLLDSAEELEDLLDYEKLDIEFAIDSHGTIHIFQVRPIVVNHKSFDVRPEIVGKSIDSSLDKFIEQQQKSPFIYGEKTILANMPDWNPAEIIGTRPKPLAFSLYQELITNDIWAKQRSEFGYSDVRPHPLIVSLSGQPYVDARASLNSFLPKNIDESLKSKLASAYIDILYKNPKLHDKIEFDVAFTVWTQDFFKKAYKRLSNYNIKETELRVFENALKEITRSALQRLDGDINSIKLLGTRRNAILKSKLSSLDKAISLLSDTKEYGTLAFSHAARAGFVATTFLNSFEENHIFTKDRKNEFLMSFKTVAGDFESAKHKYINGDITLSELTHQYGHLRPGTYEISAKAYWEDPQKYLVQNESAENATQIDFNLSKEEFSKIDKVLDDLKSELNIDEFLSYFKKAIQAREFVKFEFTKNLSKSLDLIIKFGEDYQISREELSYLSFDDLMMHKLNSLSIKTLKDNINKRKKDYMVTELVELPPLIKDAHDFYCFERLSSQPNFVTTKKALANICVLESNSTEDLTDKIILIPQADPGYDWLFGQKIAGLITKYGGANSHMAIRAAEIGLPAAIGVGDKLYEEISGMSSLELDCSSHIIREV